MLPVFRAFCLSKAFEIGYNLELHDQMGGFSPPIFFGRLFLLLKGLSLDLRGETPLDCRSEVAARWRFTRR